MDALIFRWPVGGQFAIFSPQAPLRAATEHDVRISVLCSQMPKTKVECPQCGRQISSMRDFQLHLIGFHDVYATDTDWYQSSPFVDDATLCPLRAATDADREWLKKERERAKDSVRRSRMRKQIRECGYAVAIADEFDQCE